MGVFNCHRARAPRDHGGAYPTLDTLRPLPLHCLRLTPPHVTRNFDWYIGATQRFSLAQPLVGAPHFGRHGNGQPQQQQRRP